MTTITRLYRAAWAPYIESAARALAVAVAAVYTAGYVSGRWLHNLNNALSALLVRRRGLTPEDRAMCLEVLATTEPAANPYSINQYIPSRQVETASILYHCAAVPARCGIQAPMARAISKVRSGMSQRAAATLCGVSRSSLQRAIKAA